MAVLSACSLGHFVFNFRYKVPRAMNFNKTRELSKEFDFKERRCIPGNNYFKDRQKLKQNVENIPFVGIEISQTNKDAKGVLISSIIAGSPAEKAGLLPKDIITTFAGETVNNPEELYLQLLKHKVGDNIKITVSRNEQSIELNLTLSERPKTIKNIDKDEQTGPQDSGQTDKQT